MEDFNMRSFSVILVMSLLSSFLFGQQKKATWADNIKTSVVANDDKHTRVTDRITSHVSIGQSVLATWTVIDSGRFLSVANHNIRPLAYDPDLNILTFVHQGNYAPSDSGGYSPHLRAVYYSYSTNAGAAWNRIPNPVNYPDSVAVTSSWPTNAIFNPNNNLSTTLWYGTWMGDHTGTGEYQDAMWAYNNPILTTTNVNNRE